jgi:hypothetical protein
MYDSMVEFAGFQFQATGIPLLSASGGIADLGFNISSSNASGIVLGFSINGDTVSPGSGVLITLEVDGNGILCLENLIISPPIGSDDINEDAGDCLDFTCVDADGDNICDDIDDCVGAYDDCSVCNGDNSTCAGCDGVPNSGVVVGCDDVCGSGLVDDACGTCGGDASSCYVELSIGSVLNGNMEILIDNSMLPFKTLPMLNST